MNFNQFNTIKHPFLEKGSKSSINGKQTNKNHV